MKASALSANAWKLLDCLRDHKRHHNTELSVACGFSSSTARHVLQRLVTFGLVRESIDIQHTSHRKEYQLTREGQKFLANASAKTESHPSPPSEIHDEPRQVSIVKWLRTMANEFLRMADDLSAYED